MTLGHIMQTPLSAMPPPQPDKVETQHLASPGVYMHPSLSYYIIRILPWTPRETQDFASLHGCRRQSSIEGMRSIHRIHDKVETQNLASPDESMHILSVSYSISISRNLASPGVYMHILSVSYSISASCNLASPDEPMHLSSSSYSIHITMFLQYCPTPTASRYAAWRAVRCKCWQSYSGHLQLNDI